MSHSMSMNLQGKLNLKQSQRLMLSPQMQQAIVLLQMPILELTTAIDLELEQNPVLEYSDGSQSSVTEDYVGPTDEERGEDPPQATALEFNDRNLEILRRLDDDFKDHFAESGSCPTRRDSDEEKRLSFMESSIVARESLYDHLMHQAKECCENQRQRECAEVIIGSLDDRGFLVTPLDELAGLNDFSETELTEALAVVQTFEPIGVGARDLRECLLLQLARKGKRSTLAYQIVDRHYDDMLHNRLPVIVRALKSSVGEIRRSIEEEIAKLDLQPGAGFLTHSVQHVVPDVSIVDDSGTLIVRTNNESVPGLRLNRYYLSMLEDPSTPVELKEYVRQKVLSGKWLMKNIHQRNDTLTRIATSLLERHRKFFLSPEGQMVPLTMKMIAEELGLHESTIARAVANKYIDTPRGTMSLRSFFTNAYVTEEGNDISSNTVKEALLAIIEKENKQRPLSDEAISALMKERGIPCARRTVAKYRTQFNIPNTSQRRAW